MALDALGGLTVRVTFPALAAVRPAGGAVAIYELANAMRRRGHDVCVLHVSRDDQPVTGLADLAWFDGFEEGIDHRFGTTAALPEPPPADVIFDSDERLKPSHGLPVLLISGYRTFPPAVERAMYLRPCPKVCISRWLVDVVRAAGAPSRQVVHVPLGLRLSRYRLERPIEERPARVAMRYEHHAVKAPGHGLRALAAAKRRVPDLGAVLFGPADPAHAIEPWMTYLTFPDQDVLVGDVYNGSSVFLCTSMREGFGLASLEAMACGCALVTTANGGSDEFAVDGETALVAEPGDIRTLALHVVRLLTDDALRCRLARQGAEAARLFDWDRSGLLLEEFLLGYSSDPSAYLGKDAAPVSGGTTGS